VIPPGLTFPENSFAFRHRALRYRVIFPCRAPSTGHGHAIQHFTDFIYYCGGEFPQEAGMDSDSALCQQQAVGELLDALRS
jgi:hypothetical protein